MRNIKLSELEITFAAVIVIAYNKNVIIVIGEEENENTSRNEKTSLIYII